MDTRLNSEEYSNGFAVVANIKDILVSTTVDCFIARKSNTAGRKSKSEEKPNDASAEGFEECTAVACSGA